MLGEQRVVEAEPKMAAEDFSYMLQEVPGCFLSLGVQGADWGRPYHVHTSTFRIDENCFSHWYCLISCRRCRVDATEGVRD